MCRLSTNHWSSITTCSRYDTADMAGKIVLMSGEVDDTPLCRGAVNNVLYWTAGNVSSTPHAYILINSVVSDSSC